MVFSWCSMNAENGSAPRASASVFTFVPFGTAPHSASYTCCAACAKRSASPGCARGGISSITGGMPYRSRKRPHSSSATSWRRYSASAG